jgi:chemotaxis protein histidine kinase CheA
LTHAALEADRRLELGERLTSSLQLAESDHPMVEALHRDARAALANRKVKDAFPLAAPRSFRWLAVSAVALVAVLFLPEFDLLGHREKVAEAKAEEQARRVKAAAIEEAVKPLKETERALSAEEAQLAQELERIAEGLRAEELTDRQALAKLSNAAEQAQQRMRELGERMPRPQRAGDPEELGVARDFMKALEEGDAEKAAEELRKMQEKIAEQLGSEEGASEDTREQLARNLSKLAESLGKDSAMGEQLSQMAEKLSQMDASELGEALSQMNMNMNDLAAAMEQMAAMEMAVQQMGEGAARMLSEGELARLAEGEFGSMGRCSACGKLRMNGKCTGAGCNQQGPGMGGPGRGRGNSIGELPDTQYALQPEVLPGEMTRGKLLATIMQRANPGSEAESTVDMSGLAAIQVQQEAEQALTKEEIPPGAREAVRQYFGSLGADEAAEGK